MTIPKTIHFTIPEHPSEDQLRNIKVARDLHPDWNVLVWQDPIDRASFSLAKFWDKTNSGAQLADLVRLEVVYQQGGFYLDSDFEVRRSLDALRSYPFVIASEDGGVLTNAFFGAAAKSHVLEHLIKVLGRDEVDWRLSPHLTTGPRFFARELKWRDDVTVLPREAFYPYNWNERANAPRLWTYASHHWDFSWKPKPGPRRPIHRIYRSARSRVRRLGRWLLAATRNVLIDARRRLRVSNPYPYSASGVICAQTLHGPKIFLVGEDVSVTPFIALTGTYEFLEERFIQRVVRRGDWVIDVGANVGMLSLLCAQSVGSFGRVFCYEPNPLPAGLLKKSLVMNWLHDRAEVREKALGSEPCTMRLRFSKGLLGGATLAAVGSAGTFENSMPLVRDAEEIDVEVSTLNSDFPVDLPIRLLKIDAEGFEHHVLRGGSRLLERRCVDILMLECIQEVYGDAWNEYLSELKKIIGYGYGTYILTKSSKLQEIEFNEVLYSDRDRNIVLVSEDAKQTIRELS